MVVQTQELRYPVEWRWLLLVLLALVFHGCHLGGHDDDLLKASCTPVLPLRGSR